jgi:membrane fusion protein, copper/silver efflux system
MSSNPVRQQAQDRSFQSRLANFVWSFIPIASVVAVGGVLIFVFGIGQRLGWFGSNVTESAASVDQATIFTCPMHPQIRQPARGRCPICGMELVPVSSATADLDEYSIKIEPAQRRIANIQTSKVERSPLEATLPTVGVIAIDESRQSTIAAYIDGRLERLFADYTGVEISNGDHLAVIYSPPLHAAQVEYVEARRGINLQSGLSAVRQAQESLAANTRQRLTEFGMTDLQIAELEATSKPQSRLTIYSPQKGTVVEKLAIEGNYVKAGDPIYRIAELSTVWLSLKLFPEDANRIRFGQRIEATVQSLPGEVYIGRVAFVDPTVDMRTRTVGVRVELLNENRRLRPGDYAEARVALPIGPLGEIYDQDLAGKWISPMHPQIIRETPGACPICGMELVPTSKYGYASQPVPQPESLYVPRNAVLMAGGNSIAYAETEPGRFEIRPVTLGPILHDKIIILDGLKVGESVATAGNFLIDSQMQLAGKPSLIDPTKAIARSKEPKGPLTVERGLVLKLDGDTGESLEKLYAAYFDIQKGLASDQQPSAAASLALYQVATRLSQDTKLSPEPVKLIGEIAKAAEHLHHLSLKDARAAFKSISHAIVTLATQIRGQEAQTTFIHFYCPMVVGGGGDWLQSDDGLMNPYFGSEMLRCGDKVEELPATTNSSSQSTPQDATPPTVRGN